jgi:hypothetical protein
LDEKKAPPKRGHRRNRLLLDGARRAVRTKIPLVDYNKAAMR